MSSEKKNNCKGDPYRILYVENTAIVCIVLDTDTNRKNTKIHGDYTLPLLDSD